MRALCAPDASLWFSENPAERDYAATLCTDCPFAVDCRNKARQRGEEHGVWGMETPEERKAWLQAHGRKPGVASVMTDNDVLVYRMKSALRDGKTQSEIADDLGVNVRTIQRKLDTIRDLLPVRPCDICGRALPTKYSTVTKLCDSCHRMYSKDRFQRLDRRKLRDLPSV
jgi:Transcription factor WhiB